MGWQGVGQPQGQPHVRSCCSDELVYHCLIENPWKYAFPSPFLILYKLFWISRERNYLNLFKYYKFKITYIYLYILIWIELVKPRCSVTTCSPSCCSDVQGVYSDLVLLSEVTAKAIFVELIMRLRPFLRILIEQPSGSFAYKMPFMMQLATAVGLSLAWAFLSVGYLRLLYYQFPISK